MKETRLLNERFFNGVLLYLGKHIDKLEIPLIVFVLESMINTKYVIEKDNYLFESILERTIIMLNQIEDIETRNTYQKYLEHNMKELGLSQLFNE